MNAAVSTGGVFALMSAMLFPAPLVADEEIVIGIGQSALLSIMVKFQQRYQKSHRPVILASLDVH